jgi:hypothetical protein
MKGTLKIRQIVDGDERFSEIYLDFRTSYIHKNGDRVYSGATFYVDRRQWSEIVAKKLIDQEVEFTDTVATNLKGEVVPFANIIFPPEKTYNQAEVTAIVDEAREAIIKQSIINVEEIGKIKYREGYSTCLNNFQHFPLQTKVYLQHEVDLLMQAAYMGGGNGFVDRTKSDFDKWLFRFKKLYNEKGYSFFKSILG